MFFSSPLKPKSPTSPPTTSSSSRSSSKHRRPRGGRDKEGAALSLLLIPRSVLRFVTLPFRRPTPTSMSSKSLLPSYQDQAVGGFGSARHFPRHPHHHQSPSRRRKGRCVPSRTTIVLLILLIVFILYMTGCLHLYTRISLKKDNGRIHLQTTTYNFRFSRGPIDFTLGTFRRKDWVEINVPPPPE